MAKFDADHAIFGVIAADLSETVPLSDTKFDYSNSACINLFGDWRGKTILSLLSEISGDPQKCEEFLDHLSQHGWVSFEGKLNGKFVKYHSKIIEHNAYSLHPHMKYIQAGITDITESIILKKLLYGTSEALKRAAKAADEDTGFHVERINQYAHLLARYHNCDDLFIENISQFAQLHDIGKINVAEIIRLPRKLTEEEFYMVKKHTTFGGKMVRGLTGLEMAYNIALEHHEKWDGSGYPHGKKEGEISLEARIVAVSDVFDALVSERPYKDSFEYQKAYTIFQEGDGRVEPDHFDPGILKIFLDHYPEFVELHKSFLE